MITLLEVADRARSGPKMDEKEWDLAVFKEMQKLTKEYEIRVPESGEFLNTDDDLADRAFRAGLQFVSEMGTYCISTNRVIKFTEGEVKQALREAPKEVVMGKGKDCRVFKQKKVEGSELLNICPGHHSPFTQEEGLLVVQNFAQIQRGDFLEGFNLTHIDGYEIWGQPIEAYAAIREVGFLREGVRKAGRPGMAIALYPITTKASTQMAPIDPEMGLRPTDGLLLTVLPTIKVEYDYLTTALVYGNYGYFAVNGSFGLAGGFAGGAEGSLIEGIVRPMIGWMCYRDNLHYCGVEHIRHVSGEALVLEPMNWARSACYQALNRNSNIICMEWNIPVAELCTEMHLYESAIRSIEAAINGANLYAHRVSRPRMSAGQTPLEPEFMIEVSDATIAAGIKRAEGGKVLKQLADKIRGKPPAPGKTISECYDLVKHKPSREYQELYEKVKMGLRNCGLEV